MEKDFELIGLHANRDDVFITFEDVQYTGTLTNPFIVALKEISHEFHFYQRQFEIGEPTYGRC